MKYFHNESIIMMKRISYEQLTVTYRLFESTAESTASYSALISLGSADGTEEDYFIPDLAQNRGVAAALFESLWKHTVLPCEVEAVYSDGFSEIL